MDGAAATITGWAGTPNASTGSVSFKVPGTLKNGYHSVTVSNGVGSADYDNGFIVIGQTDTSGVDLRVSNAAATSATEILVQFSKAVDPRKAELASHYRITATQGASTVQVLSAEVERPDLTTVKLTTLPQSEIQYTLKVTDLVDLAGTPLAAPSGTLPSDPSSTTFRGYGAGFGNQQDSDGDGITDADEQRGYTITIHYADGTTKQRDVTSDPYNSDTDNDGLDDASEKQAGSDPRSPDTDGDLVNDNFEWNVIYSSPADADTDADGISDGYEYTWLGTSPLLADTDGDQINDGDELFSRNRNPLVADIPDQQISISNVRLQLDQRFSYVDETGKATSTDYTTDATLETETNSSTSNTTTYDACWFCMG